MPSIVRKRGRRVGTTNSKTQAKVPQAAYKEASLGLLGRIKAAVVDAVVVMVSV
jgi:hypothetical protein